MRLRLLLRSRMLATRVDVYGLMPMTKEVILSVLITLFILPAAAIEVGDKFSLGASIEHTVTSIIKKNKSRAEFYEEITEDDAREYCDMPVFGLAYSDVATCIRENIMLARKIVVECRPTTIRIAEDVYRSKARGKPWASAAVRNRIIQGDELFELACAKS